MVAGRWGMREELNTVVLLGRRKVGSSRRGTGGAFDPSASYRPSLTLLVFLFIDTCEWTRSPDEVNQLSSTDLFGGLTDFSTEDPTLDIASIMQAVHECLQMEYTAPGLRQVVPVCILVRHCMCPI